MEPDYGSWAAALSACIANLLDEFCAQVPEKITTFALDCHPWNGVLVAAMLTEREAAEAPSIATPSEMAAWRIYDFGANIESWKSGVAELARQMRKAYEEAGSRRAAVADGFFHACAIALETHRVQTALARYQVDDTFTISVAHPDQGTEFYPPK